MTNSNLKIEAKNELQKCYDLLQASLDYHLEHGTFRPPGEAMHASDAMLKNAKLDADKLFENERLAKIKSLLKDFTETPRETIDLDFIIYIKKKTGYEIDIFKSYFKRIEKIVQKGKINTDNQLFEVQQLIYYLSQLAPIDTQKINSLKILVDKYEPR